MNKKREANRERAKRDAERADEGKRNGAKSRSSGSPAHIGETRGPGSVPGAGELDLPHNGPGVAAGETRGRDPAETPESKPPTPAKTSTRQGNEDEGED